MAEIDQALILLAAAVRANIDVLERFIKFVQQHREAEELKKENAELRRRLSELGGANK
jgi:hypothetical protein